jgi:pyroglutamyl-peptidase
MSVLITTFEPYGAWKENSSWLCLLELTRGLSDLSAITTRRYPVDFAKMHERLARDLEADYDLVLHLGQAPGAGHIRLEAVGLNIGGTPDQSPENFGTLAADGPVAYRSALPLADWAAQIRDAGVPCQVSYHAGAYLCNATLYWTHYFAERRGLKTQATFIHLPLETSQIVAETRDMPSLPASMTAAAVRLLLESAAL